MPVSISTNSVTLDINALFDNVRGDNPLSAAQALVGKFTQPLVKTPDYTISLNTYVDNHVEGEPINGTEYQVELFAVNNVRTFSFASEMLEFIDAYMLKTHTVSRISFSLRGVDRKHYEFKRKGSSGRLNIVFKELDVVIAEVDDVEAERAVGFIKKDKILALTPLFTTLKAEIQ